MANDGGLIATLEAWFAAQLAALAVDDVAVFGTAAVWRHQIHAARGGLEGLARYSPAAFVAYSGGDAAREGGYDLRSVIEITVLIAVEAGEDGIARTGDATHRGTSGLRDLVIALFDRQKPDVAGCDEIYYVGESEVIDAPRQHGIELRFEVSKMLEPAAE